MPPGPGFPDSSIRRTEALPPVTTFGTTSKVLIVIGDKVRLANFTTTPDRAVMVAMPGVFTSFASTVKLAIKDPAGTKTVAGKDTVALLEARDIKDPDEGAMPVSSTVPTTVPSPENELEDNLTALNADGLTDTLDVNFVLSTVAVTVAVIGVKGDFAVMSKSTRTFPGRIVTVDGSVISWEDDESLNCTPDAGAGEDNAITPTAFSPGFNVAGLIVKVAEGKERTLTTASLPFPPALALRVAEYGVDETCVAIGKVIVV